MLSGPAPDAITIGGPNHGQPAPPPSVQSGLSSRQGTDNDPSSVKANLQKAIEALRAAEDAEGDDTDAAAIAQIVAKIKTMIAAGQGLEDKVMGGGPGVKMIRKSGPSAGGGY
jgi:hypothetical protein